MSWTRSVLTVLGAAALATGGVVVATTAPAAAETVTTAAVRSAPGEGTEVRLEVPRG